MRAVFQDLSQPPIRNLLLRRALPLAVIVIMAVVWSAGSGMFPAATTFAQEGEESATPPPAPTRPRRPTRTPRATALPTETPLPAGAIRATILTEPEPWRVGEEAVLHVDLLGLDAVPLVELIVDVELPRTMQRGDISVSAGETARAGSLVRWRIARLEPGGTAGLRLVTVPDVATADERACVLLISRAATVEQCIELDVLPSLETGASGALSPLGVDGEEGLPLAPLGTGWEDVLRHPRALAGWALLLMGLAVLGAWLGASIGRPRDEV